jgi:hypothetical protein
MNKILIKFVVLILLVSCESKVEITRNTPDTGGGDSPTETEIELISLNNLSISNITENDFTVNAYVDTTDFSGKTITLYYCNSTTTPSCSPKAGDSKIITNSSFISEEIKNLNSSTYNAGDGINILLEIEEDSSIVDSLSSSFTLKESPEMILSINSNDQDGETAEDTPTNFFNIDGEGGEQVYLGNWDTGGSRKMWLFLNFTLSKDIPSGSTINSSYLTIGGAGQFNWDSNNYYANIYVQDTNDASLPTMFDDSPNEANGNLVFSPVRWPNSGGLFWQQINTSPDISSLVQELVDKYDGLSSGSKIQIWISTPSFGSASQLIYADYGHANHKADLSINWSY